MGFYRYRLSLEDSAPGRPGAFAGRRRPALRDAPHVRSEGDLEPVIVVVQNWFALFGQGR
ncbi:MAG: hypothetical protein ABIG68_07550 [Acidobacteriota bacterium]